jgi:hypothetical protein
LGAVNPKSLQERFLSLNEYFIEVSSPLQILFSQKPPEKYTNIQQSQAHWLIVMRATPHYGEPWDILTSERVLECPSVRI